MARLGLVIGGVLALGGAGLASITTIRVSGGEEIAPQGFVARPSVERQSTDGLLAMPVLGYARSKLSDNWGDPRGGGTRAHRGIDIMAAEGTPVVATVAGRVEKLFESELGGTTLYLRSNDGRWQYYYAHLAGYASGVREGMRVRAGQVLGYVGDTGDAGEGNYHLHFSTSRMSPGERWHEGRDVNPYPLLAGGGGRR